MWLKRISATLLLFLNIYLSLAQVVILNENFTTAGQGVPPSGWSTTSLNGGPSTDIWRFDNPGNRQVNFPLTSPFAIFDGAHYSNNSTPEDVVLETPTFDASISNGILLIFEEWFSSSSGVSVSIEGFNGTSWGSITTSNSSSENGRRRIVDVSSRVGGVTNAKLRFRFSGNGAGFWIVDNIRVVAPLNIDAGVSLLQSPPLVLNPGTSNVQVGVTNFGYSNINSVTIAWSVNGVRQPDFPLANANIPFGDTLRNLTIGNFLFASGLYSLKVWTQSPNGSFDANRLNDTISRTIAVTLCGVYTIGGNSPNFATFSDAATVLNNAGITCPVVFRVRPGIYSEQITLGRIMGSDSINTIRFESENGDSSTTVLSYLQQNSVLDYTLRLAGTSNIDFQELGFTRNSASVSIIDTSQRIGFTNCNISGSANFMNVTGLQLVNNRFSSGLGISNCARVRAVFNQVNSSNLSLNSVDSAYVHGNRVHGLNSNNAVNHVLDSNRIEGGQRLFFTSNPMRYGGSYITRNVLEDLGGSTFMSNAMLQVSGLYVREVSGNRVTRVLNKTGISINSDSAVVANNFVQTEGQGQGVGLEVNSRRNLILFNSIAVYNSDKQLGRGLVLQNATGHEIRSNIFSNYGGGYAVYIQQAMQGCSFSNNNYFSQQDRRIGFYQGATYDTLSSWQAAIGGDLQATAVNPYFSSIMNVRSNHVLLNNSGFSSSNILTDIDGVGRGVLPDRGAKEFDLCATDAGIDEIYGISSFISAGNRPVTVVLRNHGTNPLSSVQINWIVNGVSQPPLNWTGVNNLGSGDSAHVIVGSFNFLAGGLYNITTFTTLPNGLSDCRIVNDSAQFRNIATSLCGIYTIGGNSPNFATFSDAATVLNNAGITCPVVFRVRPGIYSEQITLGRIMGSDSINTIRFESENGDSSTTVLSYLQQNSVLDYTLRLAGTSNIDFQELGFTRNSASVSIIDTSQRIGFTNCNISGSANFMNVTSLQLVNNRFSMGLGINSCVRVRAVFNQVNSNLSLSNVDSAYIHGNRVHGLNSNNAVNHVLDSNKIEGGQRLFFTSNPMRYGGSYITRNVLEDLGGSTFMSNAMLQVSGLYVREVSGNRVTRVLNKTGISINSDSAVVANNFVQTEGQGQGVGLEVNSRRNLILFNTLHVSNLDSANTASLLLNNGIGHQIKNNIFTNSGIGYPVRINQLLQGTDWDYNNYYSPTNRICRYQSLLFFNLQSWGTLVGGEANALNVNPFFASQTAFNPYQRALNGAGIAAGGILLDVEGEIRNQQAPDIGADEFMIDFGITELISPALSCERNQIDSVTIYLRQFGDVPFTDLRLAYQVNGGPISEDTIAGSINNDIIYTFHAPTNLMGLGVYTLKIWLIDTFDDNINNDTLYAIRRTFPTPIMPISPLKCFETVTFNNQISVPSPHVIDSIWWFFGDGDSIKALRPVHQYANYGVYQVRISAFASSGCIEDTIFELVLGPPDSIFIVAPDTVCLGTLNFANSSDSLLTYSWQIQGGHIVGSATDSIVRFVFSQTGLGSIILNFTDLDSCDRKTDTLFVFVKPNDSIEISPSGLLNLCLGDTSIVRLSGSLDSSSSVTWYRNGLSLPMFGQFQMSIVDSGVYYAVSTYPNGCTDTSTYLNVSYFPSQTPLIRIVSGAQTICPGDTAELEVFPQVFNQIDWYESGSTTPLDTGYSVQVFYPGIYYAVAVDSNGCRDTSALFQINQFPALPIVLSISDTFICYGDSSLLTLSSTISSPPQWYRNGVLYSSGSMTLSAFETGVYNASMLDSNGCWQFSNSVILQVLSLDSPLITGSRTYCFGEELFLEVEVVPGRNYFWTVPGGAIVNGTEYRIGIVDSSHIGRYEVYFTQDGCVSPVSIIYVDVIPALQKPILDDLYKGCESSNFVISVNGIPNLAELVWILPNLDTLVNAQLQFESLHLADSGSYQVFVRQGECASDMHNFTLRVFEEDAINFPNVFTPEGDGVNDDFGPLATVYEDIYRLVIHTRWGVPVFETTSIYETWDGNISGAQAESGNYYYTVYYRSCQGNPTSKQGFLVLIR